ncbi:MAG: hypothetical protein H7Z17_00680 [Fuerstia sp.]|nr:hypothetical protein [Fuerstiella sp.]
MRHSAFGMTATIVARVSDVGLLSWLVSQQNDGTVRNPSIPRVIIGHVCIDRTLNTTN